MIRKLEKEYNLQSVQPSWEKDQHSPTTGERRQLARTGEESVRVKLQRFLRSATLSLDKATHDCPTMPELIEKAQKDDISICIGYTRTGKVKGISYKLDGVAFSGTHLGKAYTFPGLQKHRDVSYIPKRDDKRIQKLMEQNVENATSNQGEHDDKRIQKLTEQTTINAKSSQAQQNQQQIQMERNVENKTLTVSSLLDDNDIQIEQSVDHATAKENIELLQKLIEQTVDNSTPTVRAKPDDKRIQKTIEQPIENATPAVTQTNYLPTPEPANWEQVRQNLHQQYNLPIPLLNELYQKGWLYPNQTGQPIFVERTLDNVPTQAKQLELTGDFTAIPLNSEPTKNGSFWIATHTTVTRAVLLSDPIEVLSIIALESTVDKKQRQSTLYWTVGESKQIPLEFLQYLDTVVIAFKDHEKVEDLISDILAELPQAKKVSPGQAGWNKLLIDRKQPMKKHEFTQTLDWEL
ncbi:MULTISPECIES: relaxase [unclassified Dolichospermum]|uniref:relaxase n=1 Tax=unclassified Dolichospermum TaxID=2622029 RepID=UPI00158055B9|nr:MULTISPECIES: relaxase [unclassified Dolichospermum]